MSSVRYLHNGKPTIHIYSNKKGGLSLVSAKSKLLIVKQSQKVLKFFFFFKVLMLVHVEHYL